mmetsp:Transcript_97958/g.280234  ORF Transcript_97958/g.280234 Transcript_97958/m.280234 type:complete len:147 (+) Transcript_97958:155-595(+)
MAASSLVSVVIMAGAPCSGKGTCCKMAAKGDDSYHHLSTGDLVREFAANPAAAPIPELAVTAKGFMDRGELVPDEIIIQCVMVFLADLAARTTNHATCLLDGFPRTIEQAEALLSACESKAEVSVSKVVLLEAPDERVLTSRAPGR